MAGCRIIAIWGDRPQSKWRRGEVVAVLPAGTYPGKKVVNSDRFVIIDSDMTQAEAEMLMQAPDEHDPLHEAHKKLASIKIDGLEKQRYSKQTEVEGHYRKDKWVKPHVRKGKPQPVAITKEQIRSSVVKYGR